MKHDTLIQLLGFEPTQSKLAKIIGITQGSLSVRLKNGTEYTEEEVTKISKAFDKDLSYGASDCIILDYYPEVCGSCGNGVFEFSTRKELISVPTKSFFKKFSNGKNYFVINAIGDSMQPLIYDGDKLIIEQYDGEQILDNRTYVFCYQDEIFIKKLVKNIDQLVILPENNLYDVRKLEKEEINNIDILGQVVGLMRDMR